MHIALSTIIFLGLLIIGGILIMNSKLEGSYFPFPDGKFFIGIIIITVSCIAKFGMWLGQHIK
ncbi:Hypothetical protein CKL_3282 [Clostridium kluyveri DSM 555]|uniref:DUF3955 domain-containing protein n=1 Tax=Clostridium kluyveri (strain ATCC 8527 / DSM 555 / NBRC 12016 / NCIMB 10680 / K1) TaxID=431943 RepID=A5N2D9_CLOK5|nr:Hypothetical protein CKL_3282 [Clostridium kluyveri DSM 555]